MQLIEATHLAGFDVPECISIVCVTNVRILTLGLQDCLTRTGVFPQDFLPSLFFLSL